VRYIARQFVAPVLCVWWMFAWHTRYGESWMPCLRVAYAMSLAFAMRDEADGPPDSMPGRLLDGRTWDEMPETGG